MAVIKLCHPKGMAKLSVRSVQINTKGPLILDATET